MISTVELYSIFRKHPQISTDSRSIAKDSIFISLKGPSFNGNLFANAALEKGAAYAVVDEIPEKPDHRLLLVEDGLTALQNLAVHHRDQLKIPFLAITGSNGKTTTKELVRNVLSRKFRTLATRGNLNNHIGVPLTILSITDDIEFAVIEMGANHLGEIESYCKIAKPDYGLITNIGKAHLEGFGGVEGVKKGKGELFDWLARHGKMIFMNGDNQVLESIAAEKKLKNISRYGTNASCYLRGELIRDQPALVVHWNCGERSGKINSQLIGAYNFENILSAVCIGNYFDVNPNAIDEAIESYQPDNSRSQVMQRGNNKIILDAYNANPSSMEAALKNFDSLESQNKIAILGEMAELGNESEPEHRRIIERLQRSHYQRIILVGKMFADIASQIDGIHFSDSEKAANWIQEHPFSNASILIKGSRSTRMERILDAIN